MEVSGQAPAASPRTNLAASVVTAPGTSPVEKIMALMQKDNPAAAPAPQQAPQEAPQETPAPENVAEPEAPPVEPAKQDAVAREIPIDELESIELETTVKGEDGKDVVVKPTVKELREGYMRQQDYSRKTAEVARQREAVQEEVRKGVEGERAAYFQTLQMLQDTVVSTMDAELKNANWSELATNDPATYVRLDNRRKEMDRVLNDIQSKQQEVIRQRDAERAQVRNQQAAKSVKILEEKIPGWNDSLYQKLMKSAQDTYGYKPDEVGSWVDHRAFEVLHDAIEYRNLKSQKKPDAPITTKKVVVVPKAVAPGAAAPASAAQTRAEDAMKQLRSKGTISAAADVIKSRLG